MRSLVPLLRCSQYVGSESTIAYLTEAEAEGALSLSLSGIAANRLPAVLLFSNHGGVLWFLFS